MSEEAGKVGKGFAVLFIIIVLLFSGLSSMGLIEASLLALIGTILTSLSAICIIAIGVAIGYLCLKEQGV